MAIFQGGIQEFHHFIGPKIRNSINNWTKKHRKEKNGICEFCTETAELQSAHVHGRDRRTIIESVLKNYMNESGDVSCVIEEVESKILKAHEPIEETFKFICHPCHVRYDSKEKAEQPEKRRALIEQPFLKIHKIENWAKRPEQINHKIIRAYLQLAERDAVTLSELKRYCTEDLNISTFDGNFSSMKTDKGNSHGAIFYEDGLIVKIWDEVLSEIQKHF